MTAVMLPEVGAPKRTRLPTVATQSLANGLEVLAVRRPGVPRVEVRLRIPTGTARPGDGARERLLAASMLGGTSEYDSVGLAERLQRLGASLDASAGVEEVVIGGGVLANHLTEFLALIGEVVTDAQYPADDVEVHQGRLQQELTILRSQPTMVAQNALLARLYPKHPYGRGLPDPESVEGITALALRRWHKKRVVPTGSALVLVGDVRPDAALAAAATAFDDWAKGEAAAGVPEPGPVEPGPTVVVDRPGAVQTNIRVGGPAVDRADPAYASLSVANLIFGGYFSSRLMANIREDKGYSYSPRSGIEHRHKASAFVLGAEVATGVTVPALSEVRFELGRMVTERVGERELEAAQRYLVGSLALSLQTQAGLASTLAALVANGLGVDFLRDHPRRLEKVTVADVRHASERFLSLDRLVTVLVGDAHLIEDAVMALDPVSDDDAPAEDPRGT